MRTIVMTGGTSGFGAIAARRIVEEPGIELLLGARGAAPLILETIPLELADLESVRAFAATVIDRLAGRRIEALVLNAGTLQSNVEGRTVDGFETTFAVNHLAHLLLVHLLLEHLELGARVVLTTSGAHDPDEHAGLPVPAHADARRLAFPESDRVPEDRESAARRAYTASKLCNILTARALAVVPEARERQLVPIAFCPGQTPGTGLVRSMPIGLRLAWRVLGGPIGRLVPQVSGRRTSGLSLATLALGDPQPPDGGCYVALRRGRLVWKQPSQLARRDDVRDALWIDSLEMIGCR